MNTISAPVQIRVQDDDESSLYIRCADAPCELAEGQTCAFEISLTSAPEADVIISNVQAIFDQQASADIVVAERVRCEASADAAGCFALPLCLWENQRSQTQGYEYEFSQPLSQSIELDMSEEECLNLVLHDACSIMLELGDYSMVELSEEMDCSKAIHCLQYSDIDTHSCTLDESLLDAVINGEPMQALQNSATELVIEAAAWNSTNRLNLTMPADGFAMGSRIVSITFSVQSTTDQHYAAVVDGTVAIDSSFSVTDSEAASIISSVLAPDVLHLVEGSTDTASYLVSLSSEPSGVVIVSVDPGLGYESDIEGALRHIQGLHIAMFEMYMNIFARPHSRTFARPHNG
eukprot:SAG11_NODE_202_length_12550_cov_5.549835_7_plen_348_part_00